jgi:CubicO group peptidase (beta-lactamase class C family)
MGEIDFESAGFDGSQLARIDEHLTARYIEPAKIAGCEVVVLRHGHVAHRSRLGFQDAEREVPVRDDTLWRWYSMTKPVTGVALLTLYEQGVFQLTDPVSRWIPELGGMQALERDADGTKRLVDAQPITVRDAMMHMTGIGYGPAGMRLDLDNLGSGAPASRLGRGATLQTLMEGLGGEPLRFQPGTRWLYSWSTDVCARLVEAMSGQRFDDYLQANVFGPLGMVDARFWVDPSESDRLAALYGRGADKKLRLLDDPARSSLRHEATFLSGGGGLVGTTDDYLRFARMLLGRGTLDGVRVLGPRTVDLMATNHLPGDGELAEFALPGGYGEVGFAGTGFGLTVAVNKGQAATGVIGSPGEFLWGGAASTIFWIDPVEDLACIFMTQLMPSGTFNFRGQLKSIIYPAIVD